MRGVRCFEYPLHSGREFIPYFITGNPASKPKSLRCLLLLICHYLSRRLTSRVMVKADLSVVPLEFQVKY
jgi:hypothetical protein